MLTKGLSLWRKLVRNRVYGSSVPRKRRRYPRRHEPAAAVERLEDRTLLSAGTLDPTFGNGGKVLTNLGFAPGSYDVGHDIVAYQSDGKSIVVGEENVGNGSVVVAVRYNGDGSLDSTFGSSGIVRIDFGGVGENGFSVAVDSADRILVAGQSSNDFAVVRLTSAGALDTSFDSDGKQRIDFGNTSESSASVAVDSADRVLLAGSSYQSSSGWDFAVARLTSSGALDTSFDGDGKLTVDFGSSSDYGWSLAVDSADRALVAGYSSQLTGDEFAVVRLTTAGVLDSSFASDGKQTIDFAYTDHGYSVAVDSADRVLVAGYSYQGAPNGYDFAVARLTSGGALDTSFDSDGKQTIHFGSNSDYGSSVAVDSADRVLVAGYSSQGSATRYDFAVARLTTTGALDTSFDSDGKQTIDFGGLSDYSFSVAVDSTDRVLVGGYSEQGSPTDNDFAVARLTTGGTLDTSFDSDGKVTTDIGSPTTDDAQDVVAYQADGKLIVVGTTNGDMVAVRYNSDGSLDSTFGTDGIVRIDFGSTSDSGLSVAVDSADRILVAGSTYQGSNGRDFAVARLTSGGTLDTSFDTDGRQTVDFSFADSGVSVAVDSADRVLVAGYSYQGSPTRYDFAVARLTTAGALDSSFDSDGKQTIDFGSTDDSALSVAVDSADRVLVAGRSSQGSTGYDFAVARLTTGGALDTSFAVDGKQTIDFGNTHDRGFSVAVDSADRVLVAGDSYQGSPIGYEFAVTRLTSAGILDTDFDSDGKQMIDFGNTNDLAQSVTVDSGDRVLVAGYSNQGPPTGNDFAMARLTSGGALDTSFDTDGKQTIDFGNIHDFGRSVALDSAGRVLVAGLSYRGLITGNDFSVARLLSDEPPRANAGGPYAVPEGAAVQLDASSTTDSGQDNTTLTYEWDLDGDQVFGEVGAAAERGDETGMYPVFSAVGLDGPSSATVGLRVIDDGGLRSYATATIAVTNVAPLLAGISGPATGVRNEPLSFQVASVDPSPIDESGAFTYFIDWGDNSDPDNDGAIGETVIGPRLADLQHGFESKGTHIVSITATDKDGATSAIATHTIEISPAVVDNNGNLKGGGNNVRANHGSIILQFLDAGGNIEEELTFAETDVTGSLIIYGTPHNDQLVVDSALTLPVDLYGGLGDDILVGGGGTNTLIGGDGNDTLIGGAGTNTLDGGDGDDILQDGGGTNTIIGGTGSNTFVAGGGTNTFETGEAAATDDADSPQLIVTPHASGNEGAAIPLAIWAGLSDSDGSESLSVVITGVPDFATLSAGQKSADGSWTIAAANPSIDLTGITLTPQDNGEFTLTVTATATESVNGTTSSVAASIAVTVNNVAPHDVVTDAAISEYVFAVGETKTFAGSFADVGSADTHDTAGTIWTFSHAVGTSTVTETRDATVNEAADTVSDDFSFSEAGVYTVTLTVTDDDGGATTSVSRTFVVYDPSEGFVTGGGWIDSPEGAYVPDPALTGKATFGFVSKYKKGQTTPTGNTTFEFKVAGLEFNSSNYEWLVVAGARAQYKGTGTINGSGNYGFMLTVIDGEVSGGGGTDKFRMKIWNKDNGDAVVYDNGLSASDDDSPPTALGGGSIIIHDNGQALHAAADATGAGEISTLSHDVLDTVIDDAIAFWSMAGADANDTAALSNVDVQLADLSGSLLGMASESNMVWIDVDGAGMGWGGNGYDLQSAVTHELGHMLGFEHEHGGVMDEFLDSGSHNASDADIGGPRTMTGGKSASLAHFPPFAVQRDSQSNDPAENDTFGIAALRESEPRIRETFESTRNERFPAWSFGDSATGDAPPPITDEPEEIDAVFSNVDNTAWDELLMV